MSIATVSRTAIATAIAASLTIEGHKSAVVRYVDLSYGLIVPRYNKAGDKVTYRDMLGIVIGGNPAERMQAAAYMLAKAWVNGDFAPLALLVTRVFPTIGEVLSIVGIDAVSGKVTDAAKADGMDNRAAWERVFGALTKSHGVKAFKGEKLAALIAIQSARVTFMADKAYSEAVKAAELAAGTVPGVMDGETTVLPAFPVLSAPSADALAAEMTEAMGGAPADGPADATETAQDAAQAETVADAPVSA